MKKHKYQSQRLIRWTLIIVTCMLAACNTKTSKELVDEAERHYSEGKTQIAIIQLRKILHEDYSFIPALNVLNNIYADQAQYDDIIYLLSGAVKQGVNDEGILLSLTDALIHRAKFEEALSVIKNNPDKFKAAQGLALVGHCYAGMNHSEKANVFFQRALDKDKTLMSAHIGLAQEAIIAAEKSKLQPGKLEVGSDESEHTNLNHRNSWVIGEEQELDTKQKGNSLYDAKIKKAIYHLNYVLERENDNVIARYLLASIDYLQSNFNLAENKLIEILSIAPDHAESLYLSGKLFLEKGQLDKGKELLRKYLELSPDDLKATMYLASIVLRQGQAEKSIKLLNKISSKSDKDPEYNLLIGNAYLAKNDNFQALEHFKQAHKLLPEAVLVKLYLAMGYLANKEYIEAVELLDQVLVQEPENMQASLSLVTTLLQLEKYKRADRAIELSIKHHPKEPVAYYLQGMIKEGLGNVDDAISAYKTALRLNHSFITVTLRLASLYQREGNAEAALKEYKEGLYTSPYNPEILTEMALFEQQRGNHLEYIEHLELARDRNPDAITSRLLLGSYYLHRGRVNESQVVLGELNKIAPKQPEVRLYLGQVKLATGQYADAEILFSELIKLEPDSPEILTHYGTALIENGKKDQGRKAILSAVGLSSGTYPDALVAYCQVLLLDGNISEARKVATDFRQTFSKLPDGEMLTADIAMQEKNYTEAIKFYQKAYAKGERTQITIKLFNAYQQSNRIDDAHRLITHAMEKNPDDIRLAMTFASLKQKEDKPQEVIDLYHQLLTVHPDNVLILNNLAWLYNNQDRKKSLELAERAYQLTSDLPEVIDTFGWFCVLEGRLEQGLNLLQQAVRKSPSDPEIRYHLATALIKSGKTSSARDALKIALSSDEEFNGRGDAEALFKKLTREN